MSWRTRRSHKPELAGFDSLGRNMKYRRAHAEAAHSRKAGYHTEGRRPYEDASHAIEAQLDEQSPTKRPGVGSSPSNSDRKKYVFGIENEDGSLHSLYMALGAAQKAFDALGGTNLGYALWSASEGLVATNRRYIDSPGWDDWGTAEYYGSNYDDE